MTEPSFTDIALLAGLIDRPLRVEEAASVLNLSPQDVLAMASQGVDSGVLATEGAGYVAVGEPPEVDAPYTAYLAGALANALAAKGPSYEVGKLLATAGRTDDAVSALVDAATTNRDESSAVLAFELDPSLSAVDRIHAGRIHLILAIRARNQGDSDEADERASDAVRRLEGVELIDAVGFAAAIASDLQESQRAEALTALGAGLAASLERYDKAGSLLTLQGRELARLGFAEEADAVLSKGVATLENHGDRGQRFRGKMNAGWVAFDRGILRDAEIAFDNLADRASDLNEPVTQASQLAYHSRALAMVGRINEAAERRNEARSIADEHGAFAMSFLAALGEVEGALTFLRGDEALEAADAAMNIAREYVPSWLNRTLHYRAKALLLTGDREAALAALREAHELTPLGIDGWRVRNLIRVTELEMLESEWPQREAEDLTDEFLQARQYLSAAELLTIRAKKEKDPELGLQAAALARQVGAPALAALAIESAGAWNEPSVAAPVGELMRKAGAAMPDDWQAGLREVPAFAHALDADVEQADPAELDDLLSDVLTSAGLAGEVVLSPAQRRARGLVRRKPRRRRTSRMAWVAGVAAVAALVVASVALFREPPGPVIITTPTTVPQSTTTTLPPVELREVPLPENGLFGTSTFRNSEALTGIAAETAIQTVTGTYWITKPGGFFNADAVTDRRTLYLASSTNDQVYLLDLSTGSVGTSLPADGRVLVSVAVGDLGMTRGDTTVRMAVYVSEDGTVHGSTIEGGGAFSPIPLDAQVTASPVIAGGVAVVSTADGRVYGLNTDGIQWVYPTEDTEPIAAVNEEAAYFDGVFYVIDDSGELHLVDAATGELVCSRRFGIPPKGNPVVSDRVVYLQTESGFLIVAVAGECGDFTQPPIDPGVSNAIAVQDGIVYSAENNLLFPYDPLLLTGAGISSQDQLGPFGPVTFDSDLSTPPVVAGDAVVFGTNGGMVHALDLATGDELWRFDVDLATGDDVAIIGAPVVLQNTVIVITNQGHVVAIAGDY